MLVEKERPWELGRPPDKGRYEITVEDPFNNERSVSIALYTGGRWLGPSPSMKVIVWREVAEPYREVAETRFYVNGKECFTDQSQTSAKDIVAQVREGLGITVEDCIHLADSAGRTLSTPKWDEAFVVLPDMRVDIDNLPF